MKYFKYFRFVGHVSITLAVCVNLFNVLYFCFFICSMSPDLISLVLDNSKAFFDCINAQIFFDPPNFTFYDIPNEKYFTSILCSTWISNESLMGITWKLPWG